MRHMLLTTALMMPLSVGSALAQETKPAEESTEAEVQIIEPETTEAEVEEAGEDVGQAAEETGEAIENAGEAVEGTADEVEAAVVEEGEAVTEGPVAEEIEREQAQSELRVDWITDATVRSSNGEAVGDIEDLILDKENGQLKAAILGVGGFLGIGEKQIAVAWDQLQIDYDANEVTTGLTREEAEAAPEYMFRDREAPPPPEGIPATGTGEVGATAPVATE